MIGLTVNTTNLISMKVAMIARSTIFTGAGGDTVQMKSTARELQKIGVHVSIYKTNDLIDYDKYDLLHFFNIIRPDDILKHILISNIPFVVSTIYVDYSELEKKEGGFIYKFLHKILDKNKVEYLKAIGRHFLSNEPIKTSYYFKNGHYKSIRYILKNTSAILPNSESEKLRFEKDFNYQTNAFIIPNGININDYNYVKSESRLSNQVICVGRIESRKNQLNLIRALKKTDLSLKLIGKSSPNQKKYFDLCMEEAKMMGDKFKYIDHIPHKEVLHHLSMSAIHVLPSWFETTGLVSLEAAMCGCEVVVTKHGDTVDYFKNKAHYCMPSSPKDILSTIKSAMKTPKNNELKELITQNYTWEIAAKRTKEAYKKVLQSN